MVEQLGSKSASSSSGPRESAVANGNAGHAGPDWAAVREEYESGDRTLKAIEARHGISRDKLNRRRRAEGWRPRRPSSTHPQRRNLIGRLLLLLDNQTRLMEAKVAKDTPVEATEIRLLETMTKTLDRLIALEEAEKARAPRKRADPEIAALRRKLADRIERLEKK